MGWIRFGLNCVYSLIGLETYSLSISSIWGHTISSLIEQMYNKIMQPIEQNHYFLSVD